MKTMQDQFDAMVKRAIRNIKEWQKLFGYTREQAIEQVKNGSVMGPALWEKVMSQV